jgi:anti-anti-sigma factor
VKLTSVGMRRPQVRPVPECLRETLDRSEAREGTVGELLRAKVAELDDPNQDDLASGTLPWSGGPAAGRDQARLPLGGTAMHIEHAARDGCIVMALVGQLDLATAPKVRRALLKHLADQPDAVICDLAGVEAIDPACASVFAAVAHRPRSRWPDSHLLVCGARPPVAAALTRQGTPRFLPVYDTVDQALAQARSRPPFLRERLGLATTLEAFTTAGSFAGQVCQRWQLEELAETARSLAGELVIDAVFAQGSHLGDIELRVELRAGGLLLAVHSGAPSLAVTPVDHDGDPGSGLKVVQRLTQDWGVRRQADTSRVVWCILGRSHAHRA